MDTKSYSENKKVEKESSGKLFVIIIVLLIFIISVIGISMATFVYTKESNKVNSISTGNIYLNYAESTNGINITDAYPMTDELGKVLTDENQYFDFSITGSFSGNVVTDYEIAAEKMSNSTLDNDEVKLYLEVKEGSTYVEAMAPTNFTPLKESTDLQTLAGTMLLASGSFTKNDSINYRLRMWVDSDTEITDVQKSFAVKVSIKARVDLDDDKDHDHHHGHHHGHH